MSHWIKSFVVAVSFVPAVVSACDMESDGDCCERDSDCGAFFNPSVCAVIPLNKHAIAQLGKEKLPAAGFCKDDTQSKLRATVESKKPVCLDSACEFDEDNG